MSTGRSKSVVEMGELQLEVLDRLTMLGEGTVHDVLGGFADGRRPRYTTVLTVLQNLEKRGLVAHRRRGRSHVFRPTEAADGMRKRIVGALLDRVFGGSPQALVAALLETDGITSEDLRDLRALIGDRPGDLHGE